MNICQPILLCDKGVSFLTVKTLFKSKTPSLAQSDKSPLSLLIPKSSYNSLYIFFKEGGNLIPLLTLKERPLASPTPW